MVFWLALLNAKVEAVVAPWAKGFLYENLPGVDGRFLGCSSMMLLGRRSMPDEPLALQPFQVPPLSFVVFSCKIMSRRT